MGADDVLARFFGAAIGAALAEPKKAIPKSRAVATP
jgi:hypothetical protein